MEFKGKINSLDVDYEARDVKMNVTSDGKNFDIDFETYWDVHGDEFEGWEELEKSIPVMADISVGRMSLTVNYDGGEAYAYGDEAGTDIIEKNLTMEEKKLTYRDFIDMVRADNEAKNADRATRKNLYVDAKNKYEDYLRGEWKKNKQSMEEKKYVNEEGQFDFKKFVADGALEKNLNEVKNKDRYIGKHGPIFKVDNEEKIDFLQSITDPSGGRFDDADYDREDALYDEAEALGTLPQLKRMLGIYHYGRKGGPSMYDLSNRKDPLGDRNEKRTYRFKKDGEMYSVDKASMKGTAAKGLEDLEAQSVRMKARGRRLPEFTLKEIDEMLKEARLKDNK